MTSELSFDGSGRRVLLELKASARARNLRLRVDPRTGQVMLTIPPRVSRRRALQWASEHRDWIEAQLAKIVPPAPLEPGAVIPLHGIDHVVDWCAAGQDVGVRLRPASLMSALDVRGLLIRSSTDIGVMVAAARCCG